MMSGVPIKELLPHGGRMVLLTGYAPPEGENAVEAHVDVRRDSPFFDAELGGVPACVALEYMAQAMALLAGLNGRRRKEKPRVGFVLGSRRLETKIPFFAEGERYRVRVECVYTDEAFGSFDCAIWDGRGVEAAAGVLSAFMPPEGVEAGQMPEEAR